MYWRTFVEIVGEMWQNHTDCYNICSQKMLRIVRGNNRNLRDAEGTNAISSLHGAYNGRGK